MPLTEYRYGALAVIEDVKDRDWINRLLRQIDPALFVELQLCPNGERVWCVVEDTPGDGPPVTVYEHRDGDRKPLPYPTESMVDTFRRRAQENLSWQDRLRIADERNAQLVEERTRSSHEAYDDMAADFKRLQKTAVILPRRKTAAGPAAREQRRRDMERKMGLR